MKSVDSNSPNVSELEKRIALLSNKNKNLTKKNKELTQRVEISEKEKNSFILSLAKSQKMEAIGTCAGGIAHDFNNILTAIFGFVDLASFENKSPEVRECLDMIKDSSNRAKDMVSQILTFSRETPQKLQNIYILEHLTRSLKMVRATKPSSINIIENFSIGKKTQIAFDPTQFNQIIMNLCINAIHALGQKRNAKLELILQKAHDLPIIPRIGKEYLHLAVKDNGIGISPKNQEKIFQPYVTFKPDGKGTGLGLTIVEQIVKRHNSYITLNSKEGKGSQFNIYIPIANNEFQVDDEEKVFQYGSGNVLFVDDEENIVSASQKMLKHLGYEVETANNPLEALKIFKEKKFDILITDEDMPQITGVELAKMVYAFDKNTPVVLCSGSRHNIEDTILPDNVKSRIKKPFDYKDLSHILYSLTDKS